MDQSNEPMDIGRVIDEFDAVHRDIVEFEAASKDILSEVHPRHQESARNLLHYLALRSHDLRPMQADLAALGLSSLGRAESQVLPAVEAVRSMLRRVSARPGEVPVATSVQMDVGAGQRTLDAHTEAVLGPRAPGRSVAIMVTMPSVAADDFTLVSELVGAGMDVMRINCAHDSPAAWTRMIEHLRRAQERHRRPCRLLLDLAGPKIRTCQLEPGPAIAKLKPQRDALGRVVEPARVWFSTHEHPRPSPTPADVSLTVPAEWLTRCHVGDVIRFVDTRGAKRSLTIVDVGLDGCWADARKTCYLSPETILRCEGAEDAETAVGHLPAPENPLALAVGDELIVAPSSVVGRNAVRDAHNHVLTPAIIGCAPDAIFDDVQTGDRIWFDDGRIGGVIERRESERLHVRITRARVKGASLGSEKGINLPDTHLRLPALTDKDREDLAFAAHHADMIGLSFVNSAGDVRELRALLEPMGPAQPAIVLKIETQRGFENLPDMLLEAMKAPRCAVMIARGDLAVECGFERLAEVQEEVLWVCEAGHVPVIWATQVLESLAKDGLPSRAEVTDAAMAHRAECVMLNKGPFIIDAVKVLDDILRRMHGHQSKKRSMMRELQLVSSFRKGRALSHASTPAMPLP